MSSRDEAQRTLDQFIDAQVGETVGTPKHWPSGDHDDHDDREVPSVNHRRTKRERELAKFEAQFETARQQLMTAYYALQAERHAVAEIAETRAARAAYRAALVDERVN